MKSFVAGLAVLMIAGVASADTLTAQVELLGSDAAGTGEAIPFRVVGTLTADDPGNDGLAFVSMDFSLVNLDSNDTPVELGTAMTLAAPGDGSMDNFVQPLGYDANYGGTAVGNDIVQAGGAQNTIGNNPGAEPFLAFPSAEFISLDIGQDGQVIFEGTLTFSEGDPFGEYEIRVSNVLANVISDGATPGSFAIYPVEAATGVAGSAVSVSHQECAALAFTDGAENISASGRMFDGYIDPRADTVSGSPAGLSSFDIVFTTPAENTDGSSLSASAFTVSQTGGAGVNLDSIATEDGRVVTINLDGALPVENWLTVCVDARAICSGIDIAPGDGCIDIGYLPGDIDQSGVVNPVDLFLFRQYVNDVSTPAFGTIEDYADIDRNGSVSPLDLFRLRQGLNGVGEDAWAGTSLPAQP